MINNHTPENLKELFHNCINKTAKYHMTRGLAHTSDAIRVDPCRLRDNEKKAELSERLFLEALNKKDQENARLREALHGAYDMIWEGVPEYDHESIKRNIKQALQQTEKEG